MANRHQARAVLSGRPLLPRVSMRAPHELNPTEAAGPPLKRREPIFDLPFVVTALVIVLLVIHLGLSVLSDSAQDALVRQFAFIPGRLTIAIWPDQLSQLLAKANLNQDALRQAVILRHFHVVEDGPKIWTLLTYAFLHGSWTHVGLNAIWLVAFGPPLARRLGAVRFLLLFASTSIAGALTHWAFNSLDFTPLIGASAGDSGLMAAAARFVFEPGGPLGVGVGYARVASASADLVAAPPLWRLFRERRVLMFLGVWLIGNFVFGAGAQIFGLSEAPVAWVAHVGGFALGLLAFPLFDRKREATAS
jgi:membrane associated rhomboid family serine protease